MLFDYCLFIFAISLSVVHGVPFVLDDNYGLHKECKYGHVQLPVFRTRVSCEYSRECPEGSTCKRGYTNKRGSCCLNKNPCGEQTPYQGPQDPRIRKEWTDAPSCNKEIPGCPAKYYCTGVTSSYEMNFSICCPRHITYDRLLFRLLG